MLVLRRLLLRDVLAPDEVHVGLLLPPSAGAVLANAALSTCGRIAINLNYTASQEILNACIRDAGIRHVLTSRKVMDKLGVQLDAQVVYLEDFRDRVGLGDKLAAAWGAYLEPIWLLEWRLGLLRIAFDDVLTVMFTSGSTGVPKGVMLTYGNVGSNVDAIEQVVRLTNEDCLLGILPFFHSTGYTATLWTVLTLGLKGAYHFSPLDAQQVGKLATEHRATIIIATPTFLRTYMRRLDREQLSTLNVVVAGAEQLPVPLSEAFEKKFGVRPVEGYGCTELSPLVAVNIPASRALDTSRPIAREGTVGRPIPGVSAKIVHPESGESLGVDEPGLLWITGPNVMKGYLNQPELTAKVVRDGWYNTGDIAIVDADGFIRITGRQSRFSKVGGEMVPHIKIEELLQKVIGAGEDELKVAVTAVPDARRGERVVVLHTALEKTPDELCRDLAEAGLPNLWIPSADSFYEVAEIPVLGTGKLDLKAIRDLALECTASGA